QTVSGPTLIRMVHEANQSLRQEVHHHYQSDLNYLSAAAAAFQATSTAQIQRAQFEAEISRRDMQQPIYDSNTWQLQNQLQQLDAQRQKEREILEEKIRVSELGRIAYNSHVEQQAARFRSTIEQAYNSRLAGMQSEVEKLRRQNDELLGHLKQQKQEQPVDVQQPEQPPNAASEPPRAFSNPPGIPKNYSIQPPIFNSNNTILSGFAAPSAPTFNGISLNARRAFALQYIEYVRAVMGVSGSTGMKIQIRPISTCIDAGVIEFIARYLIQKPVDVITQEEWLLFFQASLDH
ncbi:unnamed protein product, partial [Aphanomyces euteiches]